MVKLVDTDSKMTQLEVTKKSKKSKKSKKVIEEAPEIESPSAEELDSGIVESPKKKKKEKKQKEDGEKKKKKRKAEVEDEPVAKKAKNGKFLPVWIVTSN